MSEESDKEALGNITLGIDGVISFGTAFAEDTLGVSSELLQGFSKIASKANFAIGFTTVIQATVQGGAESGLNAFVSMAIGTAKGAFAGAVAGAVTGKNPYAIVLGTILGGIYGQDAVEKFVAETSLSNIFGHGDGIFDPVGDKIADLHEQFPDVPLEAVTAVTMTAIEEHTSKYNPWGQPSQEVQADWIFDTGFPTDNNALKDTLQAMQDYFGHFGNNLPDPPVVPPANTNTGANHGRPADEGNDSAAVVDAPDEPIRTQIVGDPAGQGGAVTIYKDRTHIQDGDGYTGHGTQAPIILDLDGDGVEVAFGEDIYFDLDDDGFLEQTSWASADDGFLVIDLNVDGTRGAGDGVIDQSNELVLSSLGQEGARRGGLASGVVDQGRGLGERF